MSLYGEKEWYFFSPRDRKYPNGSRPNRAAGTGYWKATGADKAVGKPKTLGIKKALVFYAGKAPRGVKTNWIMHEYRLANVDRSAGKRNNLRVLVLIPYHCVLRVCLGSFGERFGVSVTYKLLNIISLVFIAFKSVQKTFSIIEIFGFPLVRGS